MSRIIAVIPARMGSSRFPGKPLAQINGRPMIEHVYRHAVECSLLDEVAIATCDTEIARVATAFGAEAIMTSPLHERATDRVAEATAAADADVIVMIQGDEPMVSADMIASAVDPMLRDDSVQCINLMGPIRSDEELRDPNTIKVVTSLSGDALYFSRTAIPYAVRDSAHSGAWGKQVCVIPFRRRALGLFNSLPQGPLERSESIDMLRFLEHGIAVRMVPTQHVTHAVDTPADLEKVSSLLMAAGTNPGTAGD